jgi:pimeloyl-ACP methyl ester carboxylesterase
MRRTSLLLLVAVVATVTFVATPMLTTTASTAARATSPVSASVVGPHARIPFVGRVIRAAGVRQFLECGGAGPITVIVIPGLHASHTMWSLALPGMAAVTRTCVYDRPGMGSSPARRRHRTVDAGLNADELWALLSAAHVPGPYVVVGHSYGGLIARAFVARHRSSVAGVLLVEGVAPFDRLSRWWHEGGDRVDTQASSRAAARLTSLGSLPLVVLAAQDPDRSYWGAASYGGSAADIADWRAHQLLASRLSRDSAYVIVRHSAHVIEHDRPDAVVAATRLLVRAVETRTWMPRCSLGHYGSQPRC